RTVERSESEADSNARRPTYKQILMRLARHQLRTNLGCMTRLWTSVVLALFSIATLHAAEPYVSTGFLKFPPGVELGPVSAVAIGKKDQIYVLHRGEPPLVEFAADGKFVRG